METKFNIKKSYENKSILNSIEEREKTLEEAQEILNLNESLWKKTGIIVERTDTSLTVEEPDGSEIITWTIEEIED